MGCSSSDIVFVDTSLGTRLAVPVSPDVTAKDFKGELERTHLNCFPGFGSIKVNALMVEKESCFYHFSESLPLKYVFMGSSGAWFLWTDVLLKRISDQLESSKCSSVEVQNHSSVNSVGLRDFSTASRKKRRKYKIKEVELKRCRFLKPTALKILVIVFLHKKKKRKNAKSGHRICPQNAVMQQCTTKNVNQSCLPNIAIRKEVTWIEKCDASTTVEEFSESASVSGIIKKYFSDYDEVASSPCIPFGTFQNRANLESSREKCTKPDIGRRLLLALDGLGFTHRNQQKSLALCRNSDKRREALVGKLEFGLM